MGYLGEWKELVLHPGREVLKRKKGFDNGKIALLLVFVAAIGASIAAFESNSPYARWFNIAAPVLFGVWFAYVVAQELFLIFCTHHLARALGGKGSFRGLPLNSWDTKKKRLKLG
jgi:hypothetical protein